MRNRLLVIILVVSLSLGTSVLTRGHEWGDDFASYIMQAESIWNGTTRDFVEHNSLTIFESSNQIGPVAYPWGYPLILSPVYALKGINPLELKLPTLFFYTGFLICLYLLMKPRLTPTESLLIVCLFAFNPLLLKFLDQILSDIPFLFFSTLALLLMSSAHRRANTQLVLLGITIFIASFIRTTGILLLVSFLALQLIDAWNNKTNRELLKHGMWNILVVGTTFGFLWLLYVLSFPSGSESYLTQYQGFQVATAISFIYRYFQVFNLFFGESIVWKILYYILFAFFVIGIWKRRREDTVFIIFFLFWMILLVTWPSWQGPRFIFPLLPIFIYFTFQGMKFVLGKLPEKYAPRRQSIFYGFWLLIIFVFLFNSSVNAYVNLKNDRAINGPFDPYSKEVYKYIQEKTPVNSVIVFFKPRVMRLMTDRDSIMSTECDRMLKGDYLVLSKKVGENQQIPPEEITTCSLPLTIVLTNNRLVVYEIQK